MGKPLPALLVLFIFSLLFFTPVLSQGQNNVAAVTASHSSLRTSVKHQQLIQFWYGPEQKFGQLGQAQRWINVLGNITDTSQVDSVVYSLNGGADRKLTLGSDLHRLAMPGDFNVELAWEALKTGSNTLTVKAHTKTGEIIAETVRLIIEKGNTWPLPYYLDFSKVEQLQEVVQVVDGYWQLQSDGVRTVQHYYDRVLSMGDTSWSNYETTVKLTINDFTPSEPGPPTYNVTHFGVAMRWRGHHADGRQPSRKWFPLGAQGEFLLKDDLDSCQWRILFDGVRAKPRKYADKHNQLVLGQAIQVKTQVATMPDGRTRYRFKQWPDSQSEPMSWDVEGFETGDYPSGALCLVPHNSDVTIHEVRVEPLVALPINLTARPGPGALHFSAPIGGVMGSRGSKFQEDFLQSDAHILALQVNLSSSLPKLVRGVRFKIKQANGQIEEMLIGQAAGDWQEWFLVPNQFRLMGISGASGWFLDSIQFHFEHGLRSPRYGGTGGDTTFHLQLNTGNGEQKGRIRGFHGSYTDTGLETLGLIFDPAE